VQLAPEYVWSEADFVHKVAVRNNVVDSLAQVQSCFMLPLG
jgi:hypothetical protein